MPESPWARSQGIKKSLSEQMKITHIKMEKLTTGRRRRWALTSLLFSTFFFIPYFLYPSFADIGKIAIGCAVYACFIIAYLGAIHSSNDQVHWPVLAIVLIAGAGMSINPASLILFGYPAFIVAYHYKGTVSLCWIAFILLIQLVSSYVGDLWTPIFVLIPLISILGMAAFGLMERRESLHRLAESKSEAQLKQISAIAERERISRDLHDLVGHSLSSIALKAELAEKLLFRDQTEKARQELSELAQLSRSVLSDVRHAVSDIKQKDLASELTRLEGELSRQGFEVAAEWHLPPLSADRESTLVMIAKELVTNILRHSNGQRVRLNITHTDNNLRMEVGDDGECKNMDFGNGLNGIVERLNFFGGKMDVTQNEGLQMTITLPLE